MVGSSRYRNPDEDLPANFNANREHYYANLGWPLDPKSFLQTVKEDMDKALGQFDQTLPLRIKQFVLSIGIRMPVGLLPPCPRVQNRPG